MKNIRKGAKEIRKVSRFPLWLFVSTTALVIVIPLLLILALHLPVVQTQVIKRTVQHIETATRLKVEIRGYRWWPFAGLHLKGLKVEASGKDILRCEKAQLSYYLSRSWPYVYPEELYLEKPVLRLEKDAEGHWQLPRKEKAGNEKAVSSRSSDKNSSLMLRFPWPRIRIASGVVMAEQNGHQILAIRDVSGILSLQAVAGPDGPSLKVHLGQWQGQADVPQWGKWQLGGEAKLKDELFFAESIVLSMDEKTKMTCRGMLSLQAPYDTDLQIELAFLSPASFPELSEKLPHLKELSGPIHIVRQSGVWSFDHELHTNIGDLKGSLKVEQVATSPGTIHWSTRFSGLEIPAIKELQVPDSNLTGHLEMSVRGDLPEAMQARVMLRLESSKWGEHSIEKGEIEGSYDLGTLTVNATGLKTSVGDFSLLSSADLKGFWNPKHRGEIRAELDAQRTNLEKVISGIPHGQRAGGVVRLEAQYEPGELRNIRRWSAKIETDLNFPEFASLKASGTYKEEILSADYTLQANDVQKLTGIFPAWQGKGQIASKGSIKGRWPDLVWEGEVKSPRFQYGRLEGEQVSFSGKGNVAGKGARRELVFKARGFTFREKKIGSLQLELAQEKDDCRFQLKGEQLWGSATVNLSGRAENIWASPRVMVLNQGQVAWKARSALVDAKLEIHPDRIVFHSLNVQQNKQKARLAGELSFAGNSSLRCSLDSINAAYWSNVLGWKDVVTGTATGEIHLSGRADQPQATLDLQLANGTLNTQEAISRLQGQASSEDKAKNQDTHPSGVKETIERLKLHGTYSKDTLQFQGELRTSNLQAPVVLSARLPVHLSIKPFSFEVKKAEGWSSTFKVAGFHADRVLPYLDFLNQLGGRLEGNGQAGGTLNQPVVKGSGFWRDGHFQVTRWPHPVEDIQLEWMADSRQINILKSEMKLLNGRVSVKGTVDYPYFDAMELEAEGENLDFPELLGIEGTVSGRAKLSQTPQGAHLTGDFKSSKAGMSLRELETDLAKDIDIVEGDTKGDLLVVRGDEKRQNSYYNRLKMDLAVDLPASGSWVRGKGLEAEITGSLRIEKAQAGPLRLFGTLQALRGTYTFQGNKLKIADGQLAFLGTPKPDPHLKIVCEKEVRDVTIQVQVTGPLSQTKLALSSVPAMNQVDILSYLIFGHPAGELNSRETVQLQSGAASWLGSETSQMLKGLFGNTPFAPDTLQFRSSTTRPDRGSTKKGERNTTNKGEGGVIEVGKYLTPDLYVTYEHGVMGEKDNQVQVEYRLNRHLSIQTQVGGADRSGVDVFWRHDFGK